MSKLPVIFFSPQASRILSQTFWYAGVYKFERKITLIPVFKFHHLLSERSNQILEHWISVLWFQTSFSSISNHLVHLKWISIKRIAQNHSQVSKNTSHGFKILEKFWLYKGENMKMVIMNFWFNFRYFFSHSEYPEYCHELFGMLECMNSREKSL